MCLNGVWKVPAGCFDGVWRVSGIYQNIFKCRMSPPPSYVLKRGHLPSQPGLSCAKLRAKKNSKSKLKADKK